MSPNKSARSYAFTIRMSIFLYQTIWLDSEEVYELCAEQINDTTYRVG